MAFSNQARLSNPSDGRPSLRSVDDSTIHIEPGQPNSKGSSSVSWTGRCDAVEANQVFYFWTNPFTVSTPVAPVWTWPATRQAPSWSFTTPPSRACLDSSSFFTPSSWPVAVLECCSVCRAPAPWSRDPGPSQPLGSALGFLPHMRIPQIRVFHSCYFLAFSINNSKAK